MFCLCALLKNAFIGNIGKPGNFAKHPDFLLSFGKLRDLRTEAFLRDRNQLGTNNARPPHHAPILLTPLLHRLLGSWRC